MESVTDNFAGWCRDHERSMRENHVGKRLTMYGTLKRALVVGGILCGPVLAQKAAMTPPMGWNSWNTFYGNISESLIKGIVDVMGTNGMRAAGYVYVNLDDNWMASTRDGNGNLQADASKFPSGIKSLADYAHSKGMKLGIYGDRGSKTCMGIANSGGHGHEAADAKTYASWGVDYIKYDNCNIVSGSDMQTDYKTMATAIANSGRSMVFSICAWQTQAGMPDVGNLWRSTDDITSDWLGSSNSLGRAIMVNLDGNAGNFIFTRPGAFTGFFTGVRLEWTGNRSLATWMFTLDPNTRSISLFSRGEDACQIRPRYKSG